MATRFRLPPLETFATRFADALSRNGRPLAADERADAALVFEASIDLEPVRIVTASIAAAPTTLGNTIRVPSDGCIDRVTLIHELAHVWQYQTKGPSYISDSAWHQLHAKVTTGTRQTAYRIAPADLAAASIHDLPAEKQAVIVERWFADPFLRLHPDYARFLAEVRAAKKLS